MIGAGLLRLLWDGGGQAQPAAMRGGGGLGRRRLHGEFRPDQTLMQSVEALVDEVRAVLLGANDAAAPASPVAAAFPVIATRPATTRPPLLAAGDELAAALVRLDAASVADGVAAEFLRRLRAMRERVADAVHEADMAFVLVMMGEL